MSLTSTGAQWPIVHFGAIAEFKNGLNFRSGESGDGVKVLGVGDFQTKTTLIDTDTLETIQIDRQLDDSYYLRKGDLVFVRSNGNKALVGRCLLILSDDEPITFSGFTIRARIKSREVLPEYISLLMQFGLLRNALKREGRGTNISNLNQGILSNLQIPLPSIPEQKAIVYLLSTWGKAIEKTERLIQAKERRFEGLVDQYIYQPAKSGAWPEERAGELFRERKETNRSDLPLLAITNDRGVIPRDNTNRKDTSNEDKSKYLRICPGDIGYNTMRMWQGVSALSRFEGIVSPAYTICIPGKKLVPEFVAFLFKAPFMIHRFYRYSQGLTPDTWNLKFRHFSEVKIPVPSIQEQKQIAELLSTAQQELELLSDLVERYKKQKHGLMQKLLTGQWRVKLDREVA